jgi:LytR cell envelope-related transcriptional attenuator
MPDIAILIAFEVPQIVKDIGAYAGFAAVLGLGVLSALYFAQARDVKRLRDWAGRAPERAAEEEARQQAAARAQAAAAAPKAATPAGAAAAAAGAGGNDVQQAGAAAGAGAGAAAGGGVATAPRIPTRVASQQTAVLGQQPTAVTKRPRWYRRIDWPAPRYIALIVAGILIVGGGAAFGVTKLLEEDDPAQRQAGGGGGGGDGEQSTRIDPADVKVSVLNGTVIPGLAAQIGDKLKRKGYQLVNTDNNSDQQRAESVVLFVDDDARDEARSVARALDISQKEQADPSSIDLAGGATVIVVIGADQTDPNAPPPEPDPPAQQAPQQTPGVPAPTPGTPTTP